MLARGQAWIAWPHGSVLVSLPEDEQREKSVSHQTVQQLVLEKEQALADLNSVEKSLADLFRRYEKMKEVLEGFRKVRGTRGRGGWEGADRVRPRGFRRPSSHAGSQTWPAEVAPSSEGSWGSQQSSVFLLWGDPVLCRLRTKRC